MMDRINRRECLRLGSLLGVGLSLPVLLQQRLVAATSKRNAKSCILVWLDGGPSHIDTFDPKPDAPREVRGPFDTVPTSVPGVFLSELFPGLASRMNDVAIIRSMTSPLGEHNLGAQYMMTGYKPSPALVYPPLMSTIASQLPERTATALPSSVAVPNFRVGGARLDPHGFLPAQFAPFSVEANPSRADFAVRNLSFSGVGNRELAEIESLKSLERRQRFLQSVEDAPSLDPLTQQAFELLRSPEAQNAFAIDQEDDATRNRYGRKTIGQSCLLARRLVEAGVPLVSVIDHGWDTHLDIVTRLKDGFTGAKVPVGLGPSLDRALVALIEDLQARGYWDDTLIVVMGEFGRTPKWNASGGRDHWPRVFSTLMAGGGIRGGTVHGTSDRYGESPQDDPTTPADFAHTIFKVLGLDPSTMLTTPDGRPIAMADPLGKPIDEIIAG